MGRGVDGRSDPEAFDPAEFADNLRAIHLATFDDSARPVPSPSLFRDLHPLPSGRQEVGVTQLVDYLIG